jgi:formyl-CoA transferase
MFSDMEHHTEGTLRVARFPVTFSETPATIRRLAPNLGEHTEEVLREVGERTPGKDALGAGR